MVTITINRSTVKGLLFAESTNAARAFMRNDGVSEFESVVIDSQADSSLDGAWKEANSNLAEKMHPFLANSTLSNSAAAYSFGRNYGVLSENITMYIVDYMMQDWLASVRPDWLASVRPDYRQKYIDRANFEMDDLLRKLYKKEPPTSGGGGK